MNDICSIPDCEKVAEKKTWCAMHYRRWYRHGSPHIIKKRPNGSGSVYIDGEGYFRVQFGRKSFKLHRMIMEAAIGRKLFPKELVHHKDGDKLNNHPNNLEIMTRGNHISHHHKGIPDNPNNTDSEKYCPRCESVKPVTDFYQDKHQSGGYRAYCIPCCREINQEHYRKRKVNS